MTALETRRLLNSVNMRTDSQYHLLYAMPHGGTSRDLLLCPVGVAPGTIAGTSRSDYVIFPTYFSGFRASIKAITVSERAGSQSN
ncbi:12900_t:CDS:1, partial [Acaulospora colombiana]